MKLWIALCLLGLSQCQCWLLSETTAERAILEHQGETSVHSQCMVGAGGT